MKRQNGIVYRGDAQGLGHWRRRPHAKVVPCPTCAAEVGDECVTVAGNTYGAEPGKPTNSHPARRRMAVAEDLSRVFAAVKPELYWRERAELAEAELDQLRANLAEAVDRRVLTDYVRVADLRALLSETDV